jgi:dihydrofolate reductase
MKIILDMAISPNGFIARENGDEDWLPGENMDDFAPEAKKHNNIVMGRETYQQVTQKYKDKIFDEIDIDHKLIVTNNKSFKAPDGYVVVNSPEESISYLKSKGLDTLFLIGGGKLNASFAKLGLVDQIQFIVTPYIIGKGRPVLDYGDYELGLTLLDVKKLSIGRVRLIYKVNK